MLLLARHVTHLGHSMTRYKARLGDLLTTSANDQFESMVDS